MEDSASFEGRNGLQSLYILHFSWFLLTNLRIYLSETDPDERSGRILLFFFSFVSDEWTIWKFTDLCVAHVIAFVEADAARPAAVATDGRCV